MYNYTWRIPLAFISPCWLPFAFPLCSPFEPLLLTWNPPSCDRIRPPPSQVACKLTSLDPPSPQPSPFQIPRTPITPRLTKTTSGTIRHLLSGTSAPWCTSTYIGVCVNVSKMLSEFHLRTSVSCFQVLNFVLTNFSDTVLNMYVFFSDQITAYEWGGGMKSTWKLYMYKTLY